jgi:hypothetical protein
MFGRWAAREIAEVSDEVRLVGVAAGGRRERAGEARSVVLTLEEAKRALKARDPGEPFR